jgi:tyrosine-protein kinase Etk/Wzc
MSNKELFPLNAEMPEPKNLKIILSRYARFWYLFLIGALLGLGSAYAYMHYYAVPQYVVYSTMLVKDDKNTQGLSSADAFNDLGTFKSTKNIDNEIEILKSKSLMNRVVGELDLSISYFVEGKIKDKEIYGSALPIKILINKIGLDAAGKTFVVDIKNNNSFQLDDHSGRVTVHQFGQQIQKDYGSFTVVAAASKSVVSNRIIVRFQDTQQIASYYNKAVIVQPISKSASVLSLSLVDPIPERAKNVINKLMEVYNKEAIEDKSLISTNTLKFLDERLGFITNELSGVEKGVERFKSQNSLTDIGTQGADYTAQASSYNTQLSEWAIQIDILESIETYLSKNTGQYAMVPSTLGIKDETLLGLIGKFNELQLERERMLRTIPTGSSLIQNINEQLSNLRVNILENLKNIKKGLQITSNNLKQSSGQFQANIKRVPGMERQLLEINRQQSIKQNIYTYLLQKREETALSLAATASAARVIDPALGGDFPISPNGQTVYLMALLLGIGLPLMGVYIVSIFDNKVQTQQDVSTVTAIPIIGEIANNSGETLVITEGSRSSIAEMFRLVRTNLNFIVSRHTNLVLMVTSSMSGEGKTFFSINLGASLALTNKRVILLDLDLRAPKIAAELGLQEGLGISNYLVTDMVSIDDIVRPSVKIPGLFVITSGPVPPNPAELILNARFAKLIEGLKERFDYIIIDTPPVGQVADAFILAPFTNFTIYLVRYNYTYKAQLSIIKNINQNKTLNHPMIVINDAKEVNGNNYGYGYNYGYDSKKSTKKMLRK